MTNLRLICRRLIHEYREKRECRGVTLLLAEAEANRLEIALDGIDRHILEEMGVRW